MSPSDPTAPDPASSDPASSDPASSDPASSDPASSDPTAPDPASSDPAASDPTASDPTPSDPTPSAPASPAGATPAPAPLDASPEPRALRLFVALELPEAARAALVAFRVRAADPDVWRPVPDEALHLTLAFLGRRPESDATIVASVLNDMADESAPRLVLGGGLLLPPRRARVLCASLDDPDGTLQELQGCVSDELTAAGVYTPEKRSFRAHVTVARLRPRARAPRTVDDGPEPVEFDGGPLTLFESRLHPHGARYEPLTRVNLH